MDLLSPRTIAQQFGQRMFTYIRVLVTRPYHRCSACSHLRLASVGECERDSDGSLRSQTRRRTLAVMSEIRARRLLGLQKFVYSPFGL